MSESAYVDGGTTTAIEDWCLGALEDLPNSGSEFGRELSDLTVVVPSRGRQDYLLRQIRYWSSSPAWLIIVDGSNRPLSDRIRSAVETHPRIRYRHDLSSMADRLRLAGGLIETPYAVMLGDDEFHLPAGLRASVETLEKDESLVGCMGQVLSFSPLGHYRRSLFARAYPLLDRYDISHLRPDDRLIAAMSSYNMATSYAVLRTPVWRKSWGSVEEYGSGVAAEIQQAMAVYLLGPFTTTSHVQWLRSIENPAGPVSPYEKDRRVWFPEWWESDRYGAERLTFVSRLAESVVEELSADRDECTAWVMAGGEVFVEENRAKFEFQESTQSFLSRLGLSVAGMLRTLTRCLPDPLFLGLKRWRGRVLRLLGRSGGDYYGTVEDLSQIFRAEGLVVAPEVIDEISSVEVMVREFHELRPREPTGV